MFNLQDLKNFDLKSLDPTKIDLTRFDVRKMDLGDFELPEFKLPSVEMPKIDLPGDIDVDRVVDLARDAAYIGVGAVVMTAQKADEARRELTDQVVASVRKVVANVA